MITMNIGETISRAIKESKWVSISYLNKSGETTSFWAAIEDIIPEKRMLKIQMFNHQKSFDSMGVRISFENIKSAEVIDFTSYDVPI